MTTKTSFATAQRIEQYWDENKTLAEIMEAAGLRTKDPKNLRMHRRNAENLLGISLTLNSKNSSYNFPTTSKKINIDEKYTVIIFSDAHWWPGVQVTPSHSFLLKLIKKLKPKVIINNGDFVDGASISRHPPIGWEEKPTFNDELIQCQTYMDEIADLAPKGCELVVNMGNHDIRFDTYIAKNAPNLEGMAGVQLSNHFKQWEFLSSTVLNDVFIWKHKNHNGVHAAYNNTLKGGVGVGTGHTHRLLVRHWCDYSGYREGVEAGTLADPYGPQFHYCEDNNRDWVQGFTIQTVEGKNVITEQARVLPDGRVAFRGELHD